MPVKTLAKILVKATKVVTWARAGARVVVGVGVGMVGVGMVVAWSYRLQYRCHLQYRCQYRCHRLQYRCLVWPRWSSPISHLRLGKGGQGGKSGKDVENEDGEEVSGRVMKRAEKKKTRRKR